MRIAIAHVLVVALAACSANDDVPAPVLASVTPAQAGVGAVVMVSGSYLCQQPEGSDDPDPLACAHTGSVTFGVVPANVTQYTDSSITCQVPDIAQGSTEISVATGGRTTNNVDFTVE
jgi:IPT/TIG domain